MEFEPMLTQNGESKGRPNEPRHRWVKATWRVGPWEQVGCAEVTATLKCVAGCIFVEKFEARGDGSLGVPSTARRLPTDDTVLRSIYEYGQEGRNALSFLLADSQRMTDEKEARTPVDAMSVQAVSEEILAKLIRENRKQSDALEGRQLEFARRRLREKACDPTITDGAIVHELMHLGLTETTARRRLKRAREQHSG